MVCKADTCIPLLTKGLDFFWNRNSQVLFDLKNAPVYRRKRKVIRICV